MVEETKEKNLLGKFLEKPRGLDNTFLQFGGDEQTSIDVFNSLSEKVLGENTTLENKMKFLGQFQSYLDHVEEASPQDFKKRYSSSDSGTTLEEAAEVFNPKFVRNYLKETTKDSKEYKAALNAWRSSQLTEDSLFVPNSKLTDSKTQDFINNKTGYYTRSRQDIQDAGRVVLKGAAAVGASVADLSELAGAGLDYTIGTGKTDYIRKGLSMTPIVGDLYDLSNLSAKARDSDFLEYKGQLSQKPRLSATIDFIASLPGFSKLEKIAEVGMLGIKATKYGSKSKGVFDKETFTNIDKAILKTKDNLLGKFKKRSLEKTKGKLQRYNTLGAARFKQELDKKHHLINLGLGTFWAGGQAMWGGEKEEGAFFDFNNNPVLQGFVGVAGVLIAPQILKATLGMGTDLVNVIETAITPGQTRRSTVKNKYNMSDKDIDALSDSEVKQLHEQTDLQDKATAEFIERFEYDRQFRTEKYENDVGLLQTMKEQNDQIKDMSFEMYKAGKSKIDSVEAIELANLRAEHVLMSDVLAGIANGAGRLDGIPLSGKLPKEFNLQSEIEQLRQVEANIRQTEVDALNYIMPTAEGSTPTLGAGSNLMKDVKMYHQKRLSGIEKKREDTQIAIEDAKFKSLAKSKTRDDYYEPTFSQAETDPLNIDNPEFVNLRKEFLDDTKTIPDNSLDTQSQGLIKSVKGREEQKFSKIYNTIRGDFGRQTVNLEDENLSSIFKALLERGGKSADMQIPDEAFTDYSNLGLATPEGIGQKGFSKSNVKKIYKDASKELVWNMEANDDLVGLRKLFRNLEANYDIGDTDIKGFTATKLATEIDNLISSGKTTDGEISLHAIHTWKSDAFQSALEASAANNKTLAKSYYETANDLSLILETATDNILKTVDTGTAAGQVLSRSDIIDSILTYRKADKDYFDNYVMPFKQGIGNKISRTDSSGAPIIPPENIFQQFIKAPGAMSARKDYNQIFKNATEQEIETGKNLLMENIRRSIRDDENVPDEFLDNFGDLIGKDNVSKIRRIQDGFDLHQSSLYRKQAEGNLSRTLDEMEAGLGPDIDALTSLKKQITDEDPTKIFQVLKGYNNKNLTKLIDGLTQTRLKRRGNNQSEDMIRKEIEREFLSVTFDGVKQEIIKLQDQLGGVSSTSELGFKKFLQKNEELVTDDITQNYFMYLEEIDGKVAQKVLNDTKNLWEALGGQDHVKRLNNVLGQTKVRDVVSDYVGTVGGMPSVMTEGYFFGRSYNAVKGHLSYRYLITEAVLKTIRKKRVDLIAEIVTNPNITQSLLQGLYSPNPTNTNLRTTAKWLRLMYAMPEDTTDDEIKDGIKALPPSSILIDGIKTSKERRENLTEQMSNMFESKN
jgi:hypothetical protein